MFIPTLRLNLFYKANIMSSKWLHQYNYIPTICYLLSFSTAPLPRYPLQLSQTIRAFTLRFSHPFLLTLTMDMTRSPPTHFVPDFKPPLIIVTHTSPRDKLNRSTVSCARTCSPPARLLAPLCLCLARFRHCYFF